jgi:hypothetical protein
MYGKLHSTPPIGPEVQHEPQWELVRVVVMRDEGVRPANFKIPTPGDDNTYIGRCRFVRADGGKYWRPAHFELRQDVGNTPASLRPPLFDPYLVNWVGAWQIFAGWGIHTKGNKTFELRQLWAISRDLE